MDLIIICAAQCRRRPESALKSYTAGGKGPGGHFKAWRRLFIAEKIINGNLISDILNVQLLAGVFPLTAEAAECIFIRGVLIIKKCLTFYSLRYIIKKLSEQGIYIAGWSSLVARRAHNPKVVGSNPSPATTIKGSFL